MTFGYVYALINPSLGNLIKVGKTTRNPMDRASELSAATGVPTPFILAYQQEVKNCDAAELWVHKQLGLLGYRINDGREFFSAPLHEVVALIGRAAKVTLSGDSLEFISQSEDLTEGEYLSLKENSDLTDDLFFLGCDLRNGTDTVLKNPKKSLQLFKQAADLGCQYSCMQAGSMYEAGEGIKKDFELSLVYYRRAAEYGHWPAFSSIARIFSHTKQYSAVSLAWGKFFASASESAENSRDNWVKIYGIHMIYAIVSDKEKIIVDSGYINFFHVQLLDGLSDWYTSLIERYPERRNFYFRKFIDCRAYLNEILASSLG